jgi:hypothetical protein
LEILLNHEKRFPLGRDEKVRSLDRARKVKEINVLEDQTGVDLLPS